MKIKSPYALFALILMGASAPALHAAVDLLDVAFVAVPAVLGALTGREIVKQAIQDEKEERGRLPILLGQTKNARIELQQTSLELKNLKSQGVGILLINAQMIPIEGYIKGIEAGLREVTCKIDELEESIDELDESLARDESKRLRNGALVGGAVGAGLGLVARVVFKYEVGQRKKRYEEAISIPLWRGVEHSKAVAALNLPRSATLDEVKTQYRALAIQEHPDKHSNSLKSTERFRAIKDGYEFLIIFLKSEESNTVRRQDRSSSQGRSLPLIK